jgi:large repetitive protein
MVGLGVKSFRRGAFAALSILIAASSCTNPAKFVESVKSEVKTVLGMYLEAKSFTPANNAVGISPTAEIFIEFDRAIDPASVTDETLKFSPAAVWTKSFNEQTKMLRITPEVLDQEAAYTVSLTTGIKAVDGALLKQVVSWGFTTKKGPVGAFSINGGASFTKSPDLVLTITSANSEVYRMYASEDTTAFASDHLWSASSEFSNFSLSDADGKKTVYVQFANNASPPDVSRLVSKTITLDRKPPAVEAGEVPLALNPSITSVSTMATVDDDSPIASYLWTLESGPSVATIASADSLVATVSNATVDGSYSLRLVATDAAGNSASDTVVLLRDTVLPAVDAGSDLGLTAGTPTKELSPNASDLNGIAHYEWSVVSTPAGNALVSFSDPEVAKPTVGVTADGDYIIRLTVTDGAGNKASDTLSINMNSNLPGVYGGDNLVLNIAAPTKSTTASVPTNDKSAIESYAWTQVSGPGTINFGSPHDPICAISADLDGSYTIRLTVTSYAASSFGGATNSADIQVVRDTVAPSVSIDNSGSLFSSSMLMQVTAPDAASYSWSQSSGPGTVSFSSSAIAAPTVSASVDGAYGLALAVTDAAGNSAAASTSVTRDSTAPSIEAGASRLIWNVATSSLATAATATDALSGIASVAWTQESGPGRVSFASPDSLTSAIDADIEGRYVLLLTVTDKAGNFSTDRVDFIKDSAIPSATTLSTSATLTTNARPTWSWTAVSDSDGRYRYKLDGAVQWSESSELSYTPATALSDGAHSLEVQAGDYADNWSSSATLAITVDTVAPGAPTLAGTTPTNDPTPAWTWSQNGSLPGNGSFRYQLDSTSGAWTETTATSFEPTTAFVDGSNHVLYVQERDQAGNWSPSASRTIRVDTSAPSAPVITASVSSPTNASAWTWSWSLTGLKNCDYTLVKTSGSSSTTLVTASASSATSYTASAISEDASYILSVTGRDSANNTSTGSSEVVRDTVAPGAPTVSGDGVYVSTYYTASNDSTPTWTWTQNASTPGGGVYSYALDSVTRPAATTTVASYTPASAIADGSHYLCVWERDAAGNWSGYGYHYITVDTAAPTAPTITEPTDATDRTPTWSWTAGAGGNGGYTYALYRGTSIVIGGIISTFYTLVSEQATQTSMTSYTSAALSDGSYKLIVKEYDTAGNYSSSTSFFAINALPNLPSLSATTTVGNYCVNTKPTFSWSSGGFGNGSYDYYLYNSTTGLTVETFTDLTDTSYTPSAALAIDNNYRFYVREHDAGGEVGSYTVIYRYIRESYPVSAATGVSKTPTLYWNAATNATTYYLDYSTGSSFATGTYSTVSSSSPSYTFTTALASGTKYYWRVRYTYKLVPLYLVGSSSSGVYFTTTN